MTKVNFILFFVILLMALAKINSQHQSRKLFFELDQQKEIETLKEDLRVALDAYRTLVIENARERH